MKYYHLSLRAYMPRQHWHINYIDLSFAFNIFIKETLCTLIIVKKTPVSAFLVLHCFQYPQITDTSYSWIIPLLMVQLRVNCPIPQNISRTIYCYCYQSLTQNAGHIKLNIATCVRGCMRENRRHQIFFWKTFLFTRWSKRESRYFYY